MVGDLRFAARGIGAVAGGRLGTLVGAMVLPLAAGSTVAMVRSTGRGAVRVPRWQHAVRMGWWLTVLVAFVPVAYVLLGTALLVGSTLWVRGRAWFAVAGALMLPWLLLGPWLWQRALDPELAWWEAGRADAGVAALTPGPTDLAVGSPGAATAVAAGAGGLLLLAAVLALLARTDRRRPLTTAWLFAVTGLAAAVVGAGQRGTVDSLATSPPVWVGFALLCWSAGLATATALAADRLGDFLASHAFGWRQPVAVLTSGAALAVPVVVAGGWLLHDDGDLLRRGPAVPLPEYLSAQAIGSQRSSTLVVSGTTGTGLGWSVVRDDGLRLGEEFVQPAVRDLADADGVVASVVSHPTAADVSFLLDAGVGAIYAPPPVDRSLAAALDSAAGVTRSGTSDPAARAWQLNPPTGDLRVVGPDPGASAVVDAAGGLPGSSTVPAGAAGRVLHVAAPASAHWTATLDGAALAPLADGSGQQAFMLPGEGGHLDLSYDSRVTLERSAQLLAMAAVVVLALPARRRLR